MAFTFIDWDLNLTTICPLIFHTNEILISIKSLFWNTNIKSELYYGCTYQYNSTINTKEYIAVYVMNAINITFIQENLFKLQTVMAITINNYLLNLV